MENFISKITAALAVAVLAVGLASAPAAVAAAPRPKSPTSAIKGWPPVPGQLSTKATCGPPTCYRYASAQLGGTSGITATKSTSRIAKPSLDTADYHTLAETSIQGGISGASTGSANILEVGWTVDRVVNGGSVDPHVFVSCWVDNGSGTPIWSGVYNGGCGWIDKASNPVNAGSSVFADLGTEPSFEIYRYAPSNAWIVNYKGVEIGRWPDSLGTGTVGYFSSANLVQNFGEVAIGHDPSCTKMGNGNFPGTSIYYPTHGAEFKALNIARGGGYSAGAYTYTLATAPSYWDGLLVGTDQWRYGGKGAGAPTTVPTPCP